MALYCHGSGCETAVFDDAEFMCDRHNLDLVPDPPPARDERAAPPPDAEPPGPTTSAARPATPDSGRSWKSDKCWNCEAVPPNPGNTRCLQCPESLVPPRLLLTWGAGTVRLDPGDSVQVGREGPHARLFRDHGNVSRRHAMVGVDQDGTAWIEPLPAAINGTFRPGDTDNELLPGRRYELRDGETVRFARDVTASVAVFALPDR